MIVVIGIVGIYVAITLTDLILGNAGFDTGFPSPTEGYYLFQSVIYIVLGLILLSVHYYILGETSSKELSNAFLWSGAVLAISGAFDLILEAFLRVDVMEIRLLLAVVLLAVLVFITNKYRDKFFKNETKGIPAEEKK